MSSALKYVTRAFCFSIALILGAFSGIHAQSDTKRSEIVLVDYKGAIRGQLSWSKFEAFQGLIQGKVSIIKKEIMQTLTEDQEDEFIKHLKTIRLSYLGKDEWGPDEDVGIWLEGEPEKLIVMRGTIHSDDNVKYTVYSRLYFGELHGHLPYELISIKLPIEGSEFANAKDSHSLAILYSFAMEAKIRDYPKDRIAQILKTAKNKVGDLERRLKDDLSGDLAILKRAIEKAEEEILR